jgi:hypothetical protein
VLLTPTLVARFLKLTIYRGSKMKCSQRDFNIFVNTTKGISVYKHMVLFQLTAKETRRIIYAVGKAIIDDWNATITTPVKVDPTKRWYRGVDGVNKVDWNNIDDLHALRVLHNWFMKVIGLIVIEFTETIVEPTDTKTSDVTQPSRNVFATSHLFKDIKARPNANRDTDILKNVLSGSTYASVGKLFNLTGARIREIVCREIRKINYFWNKKHNRDKSFSALPAKLYAIMKKEIDSGGHAYFGIFTINDLRDSCHFFLELIDEINSPLLAPVSPHDVAPGVEVVSLPSHNKQMNAQSLVYLNSIINS